eukprot:11157465-Lingulodinium_polyedra.AAC.1
MAFGNGASSPASPPTTPHTAPSNSWRAALLTPPNAAGELNDGMPANAAIATTRPWTRSGVWAPRP